MRPQMSKWIPVKELSPISVNILSYGPAAVILIKPVENVGEEYYKERNLLLDTI